MWIHRWRKTSGSASTPGPGERTCVKWQNLCHPSVFDPWRWYESVLDCKRVPKPKKELQPIPSSKHRRIIFFSLAVSSESNFYSVLVGFFFGHWLNFLDWQNWPLDFYFTLLSLSLSLIIIVGLSWWIGSNRARNRLVWSGVWPLSRPPATPDGTRPGEKQCTWRVCQIDQSLERFGEIWETNKSTWILFWI